MSGTQQDQQNARTGNKRKELNDNQFKRLNKSITKSSAAKAAQCAVTQKDSLDFSLNSIYDHHYQWWASKHVTVLQNSTNFSGQKRKGDRVPNNNARNTSSCVMTTQEIGSSSTEYRNDPNHLNMGVWSPHLSNSRRGFGRSIDGSFYNL